MFAALGSVVALLKCSSKGICRVLLSTVSGARVTEHRSQQLAHRNAAQMDL